MILSILYENFTLNDPDNLFVFFLTQDSSKYLFK